MIEGWFYWTLVSDPRTALWFGFRVRPVIGDENVPRTEHGDILPHTIFWVIDANKINDLGYGEPAREKTFMVAVFAPTYQDGKEAMAAVEAVLDRATGSGFGVTVQVSLDEGEQDDGGTVPVNGKDRPLYSVTKTFRVLLG